MAVAIGCGVPLGFLAAIRQDTRVDRGLMFLAVIGISTPSFVVATVLIVVFGVYLRWVPTSGWAGLLSRQALIPVFALALWPLAAVARYARSSMLDVIRADYVRTAKAKGLRELTIVVRHAGLLDRRLAAPGAQPAGHGQPELPVLPGPRGGGGAGVPAVFP